MDLTEAQKQELDRRSRAYEANPNDVMTREEVRASIVRHYAARADYAAFDAVMAKVPDVPPMPGDELE
jgi:Putative addiction module component